MSEHISVGSVSVDVVPNTERFARDLHAKLDPQSRQIGDQLGKIMGRALANQVSDGVRSGLRDGTEAKATADVEGAKAGKSFADAFSRIAKTKIAAALKDLPKANLNIDATKADLRIAEMRRQLSQLGKDIALGVDDKEAVARIAALAEFMRRTLKDAADIRVRVDVGRALGEIEALKAALGGSIGGGKGGARVAAADSGSGGIFSSLAALVDTGGAGLTPMTIAIGALIAMAPALYNAAVVITAGIAGIVAALSLATIGFGAFALAGFMVFHNFVSSSGDYQKALKTQASAQQAFDKAQIGAEFALGFDKGNAKAPGAAAAALAAARQQGLGTRVLPAGLSASQKSSLAQAGARLQTANQGLASQKAKLGPSGVALANDWQALQKQFDSVTSQLAPLVYPALSAGIRLIGTALQYLAPVVKAVSPVIVSMLDQAGKALAGPDAKKFIDFIIKNAPAVMKDIGSIVGHLISAVPGFIEAFTPIGKKFLDWLDKATGGLGKFFGSQTFKNFLSDVKADAPAVLEFFKKVGGLIYALLQDFHALSPLGTLILNTLSHVVIPFIEELARAAVGLIGGLFIVLGKAMGGILNAMANVADWLHLPFAHALHTAADNVTNWTNGFQTQLKTLQDSLNGVATGVKDISGNHKVTFTLSIAGLPKGPAGVLLAEKLYGQAAKDARSNPDTSGGHFSTGGLVTGPGTATSDSIPRWLSNGEYVMRTAAVTKYGAEMMRAVNDGTYQPAQQNSLEINVEGYGAHEVATAIVRKQQAYELLHGRR